LRFLILLIGAALLVAAISLLTNRMAPKWDMECYLDMASNGVIGNKHLVAPFAYRPAAPLLIGAIAHLFHADPERTFRFCAHLACIVFVLCCFYFAKSMGSSDEAAALSALAPALYFNIVKWPLFAGEMVDIYAYPLILFAFWALVRKRFYLCLLISSIGLFFKEFMLVPLLAQAAFIVIRYRKTEGRKVFKFIALTALAILLCFVLPRLLIHVVQTFQDIDPINQPSTLRRLYLYPLSRRRDFNIVFAYLAWWLPVLLLITRQRLAELWRRLADYRWICLLYVSFHFLLVMYGGTNLTIFVTYSLPVQILVLAAILDTGDVHLWEKAGMFVGLICFNRLWMLIPAPQLQPEKYLEFYGGYHMLVTARSFARMAELLSWILAFWAIRALLTRLSQRNWDLRLARTGG
jgi:hypothetical protein